MKLKNEVELRAVSLPLELRADTETEIRVAGYAAVFGEEAVIWNSWREVIAPGAFGQAIKDGDDVVFLIDHQGQPLARTTSGTLTLTEDNRGLLIETSLDPSDPDVQRIIPKMRRGDMDKMSFAMLIRAEKWSDLAREKEGILPLRTVEEVSLRDVSIVTRPAYDGTEIGLRSLDQARADAAPKTAFNASSMKARLQDKFKLAEAEFPPSATAQ